MYFGLNTVELVSTPMTQEARRCQMALDLAKSGKTVALVCSGDSGIYGMAALVYQLRGEAQEPEVEAIPGLTAACSGGALLGAIFMATDYSTSPMTVRGSVIFGVGIGAITMCIRLWGAYPEGMSFAILIMNAVVPLINKYVKPKRFGVK